MFPCYINIENTRSTDTLKKVHVNSGKCLRKITVIKIAIFSEAVSCIVEVCWCRCCPQVAFFVLLVLAVASAQILYPSAYEAQGVLQAHSPFAVSSSARVQTHNNALLGLGYGFYWRVACSTVSCKHHVVWRWLSFGMLHCCLVYYINRRFRGFTVFEIKVKSKPRKENLG